MLISIDNALFLYGAQYTYDIVTAQGPDEGPLDHQKAKPILVRYKHDIESVGEVLRISEIQGSRTQAPKVEHAVVALNVLLRREVNAEIRKSSSRINGHRLISVQKSWT